MNNFKSFLNFLQSLNQEFLKLHSLQLKIIAAVKSHDLDTLNAHIKEEQALSLSLRGLEIKKKSLISEIGLAGVPLRELHNHCDPSLKDETLAIVTKLLNDYNTLEEVRKKSVAIIEKHLSIVNNGLINRGVVLETTANYEIAPNKTENMRTDFRA